MVGWSIGDGNQTRTRTMVGGMDTRWLLLKKTVRYRYSGRHPTSCLVSCPIQTTRTIVQQDDTEAANGDVGRRERTGPSHEQQSVTKSVNTVQHHTAWHRIKSDIESLEHKRKMGRKGTKKLGKACHAMAMVMRGVDRKHRLAHILWLFLLVVCCVLCAVCCVCSRT